MPDSCQYTDQELFNAIAKGNEQAFSDFFYRYNKKVYYFILHITGVAAIAEELVQDVFLRLWLKRASLGEIDNPGTYLFVIAKNRSLDQLDKAASERRLKEQVTLKELPARPEVEEKMIYRESVRLISEAVEALPRQQQLIYQLSREQGLSRDDIAARLQVSPHTVKNHLGAAIKRIQEYLSAHYKTDLLLFLFIFYHYLHNR